MNGVGGEEAVRALTTPQCCFCIAFSCIFENLRKLCHNYLWRSLSLLFSKFPTHVGSILMLVKERLEGWLIRRVWYDAERCSEVGVHNNCCRFLLFFEGLDVSHIIIIETKLHWYAVCNCESACSFVLVSIHLCSCSSIYFSEALSR